MRIKKISKDEASVWFSRDELSFMIASTERALKGMEPDEFHTRTSRTVDYANAVLAQLRVANGDEEVRISSQRATNRARGIAYDPRVPTSEHVTMRVELVAETKALVALADHELRFLNNAINESVNGLRGVKEFEVFTGKTSEYSDKLMSQLIDANDRIEALS